MNLSPFVEHRASQQALLNQYVSWQLVTALSLGVIILGVAIITSNQVLLTVGVSTLVSSATFRLAQGYLQSSNQRLALLSICAALLMLVAANLVAAPLVLPVLVLLPLLLVAVVLPFVSHATLRWIAGSIWLLVMFSTLIGLFGEYTLVFPQWRGIADRAVLLVAVGGIMALLLLLLSQFHLTLSQVLSSAHNARTRAEQQAQELQAQTAALQEAEQRLIDLVATLETPVVTVAEGVVLAPIIGLLDARRTRALTDTLLDAVHARQTNLVIVDIAGVPGVDTHVAHALLQTAQGLRLLGCQVVITGIASSVAATMMQLGIHLNGVATARSPLEVLAVYHTDTATAGPSANQRTAPTLVPLAEALRQS